MIIHKLPVELITRIFVIGSTTVTQYSPFLLKPTADCYVPSPSGFQLLVSHVCSRWRQIALHTPSLWTSLHFREPTDLDRARVYLSRCSSSSFLLEILVDTVAASDHIPGVTLCRDEFHPIFDIIVPHVRRWKAFFLKIRDNECKVGARARLSTCGPAPNLETLQLYHFEHFETAQNLELATYRPPVMVFENTLPRLKNISLIGVNLPWRETPFLCDLHEIELALHRETVRPPYKYWERMLRSSPALSKLTLHYSGPRVPPGWMGAAPAVGGGGAADDFWQDERVHLPALLELSLTDLDPEYLCLLLNHLSIPAVKSLALDLPEQNFTPFVGMLAGIPVHTATTATTTTSSAAPYFGKLERLVVNALECNLHTWIALLRKMRGLKVLEVDFKRVGDGFFETLLRKIPKDGEDKCLLPMLETVKTRGLSGQNLASFIAFREACGCGVDTWLVRWCEKWRGSDLVLDRLIELGWRQEGGKVVRVESWVEEEEEGEEEEEDDEGEGEDEGEEEGEGEDEEGDGEEGEEEG